MISPRFAARAGTSRLRQLDQGHMVVGFVIVVCVLLGVGLDGFLTTSNLLNIGRSTSVLAIVSLGVAVTVIGGGIDLSVIAVWGITGALIVNFSEGHASGWALLLAFVVAVTIGLINGLLVAFAEIPPLFVTLATNMLFLALVRLWYVHDYTGQLPDNATWLSDVVRSRPGGIPTPLIVVVVVAVLTYLLLRFTTFGRALYAQGDKRPAAVLSGLPVRPITVLSYVLSALLAFVAGVVSVGVAGLYDLRITVTGTLLYDAVAVVVIGGVSLAGGRGGVVGVMAAAALIGVVTNALVLLNFDSIQQRAAKALIVLVALVIDSLLHPRDDETARPGEL